MSEAFFGEIRKLYGYEIEAHARKDVDRFGRDENLLLSMGPSKPDGGCYYGIKRLHANLLFCVVFDGNEIKSHYKIIS